MIVVLDPNCPLTEELSWLVGTGQFKRSVQTTSGKAIAFHCKIVPLAFQPLDDSNGTVTYDEVVGKIKEFRALSTASGLTVLTDLHCAFVGIATEKIWMESTRAVGGSGRTYDQSLFCRDDRLVWVTGLTERDRGREMENWGMKAVEEIFGFMYNDVWSGLH